MILLGISIQVLIFTEIIGVKKKNIRRQMNLMLFFDYALFLNQIFYNVKHVQLLRRTFKFVYTLREFVNQNQTTDINKNE